MEILTASKEVDIEVLVFANWKNLKPSYVWLRKTYKNYFQLETTKYKVKPYKDCWYLGEYTEGMTREEFNLQIPNNLSDAFIELATQKIQTES